MFRHGMVQQRVLWYTLYGMVWYSWYGVVCCGVVLFGMMSCGILGMVWIECPLVVLSID